jgi:vanillate O-demethylase ferredoxin subunit
VAGGIGMALLLSRKRARPRRCNAARNAAELVSTGCANTLTAEIAALGRGAQLALCGPLGMRDAARESWAGAGRASADLRFETFGNSGRREAEAFWVERPRHGLRLEAAAGRPGASGQGLLHNPAAPARRGRCFFRYGKVLPCRSRFTAIPSPRTRRRC